MKQPFLFLLIVLFSSCSGVEGYRFNCILDDTAYEADEIPVASVTSTTITISVRIDSSRFQITTPYGEQNYTTGGPNGALIQYWPDENEVSAFYSSEGPADDGEVLIDRITSLGVSGMFKGMLYKDGADPLQVKNGVFFAHRP